jgi:GINS complex subunit 1
MCWRGIDVLEQQQPVTSAGAAATNNNNNNNNNNGNGNKESATEENNSTTNTTSTSGQNSLSPEEEEYFRLYSEMLAAYKGQWTDIDLTGSLEPPKDLFIDVRVLKDAGEIQTEYGYVLFFLFLVKIDD